MMIYDVYGCIWLVVKLLLPELGPITAISNGACFIIFMCLSYL